MATLFGSPMLWALGVFGTGDDALHRAVIFGLAGLWFFVGTFYVVGWAVQGFVVRQKAVEEDEDGPPRRSAPCAPSSPPPARPPSRSSSH